VTGNRDLEREGEREKAAGKARQEANRVIDERGRTSGRTVPVRSWVGGSFPDRDSAERAYRALIDRGYTNEEINLIMSDDARKRHFADVNTTDSGLRSKAMEGAGIGGAIGSVAGGLLGALVAIGTSVMVPGLGLVVAGPLVTGLAGAGAGGLTGGILGALIGSGIPEDRAKEYESDIKNGRIVMGVTPRSEDDAQYFDREWRSYRGGHPSR
jgi:hypothetical protein